MENAIPQPFRLEKFRTAHSNPAGYIVLEMAQEDGVGCQFSMSVQMAQQIVKSLQDQISKTQRNLN
jgi:hypothetical protein